MIVSLLPGLLFCLLNHQAFSILLFHIISSQYFGGEILFCERYHINAFVQCPYVRFIQGKAKEDNDTMQDNYNKFSELI